MKIFENLDINNLNDEIWKIIINFSDYSVSSLGRVKSFKQNKINGKILKQYKDNDGYFVVWLYKNKIKKTKHIHRLVYEAHKEKLEDSYDVHHIDKYPENNMINNLESIPHNEHLIGKTASEKTKNKMSEIRKQKFKSGELNFKGENNPNCKKTKQEIVDIKIDIEKGDLTQKKISKKYGISQATTSRIKRNIY